MDSTSNRRPDRSSVADEKGNPFVSFSRLVDQQISSILRTFSDLPSSFSRSKTPSDDYSPDLSEQQRRWDQAAEANERLEKSLNELFTPFRSREPVEERCPFLAQREKKAEEADSQTRQLQDVLHPRSQNDLQSHFWDQRKDRHEECAEADRVIESICNRLFQFYPCQEREDEATPNGIVADLFLPRLSVAFPRTFSAKYSDESPESPPSQDDLDSFREYQARWRKAFEDLVLSSHRESLSDSFQESFENQSWKPSLAERGLAVWKPQSTKTVPADDPKELATQQSESHSSEDAATELDLYERFPGQQSPRFIESTPSKTFVNHSLSRTEPEQPSLISTLTTTQRRTLPDGSVYTQVVLKKRFSDGKEESTETEHTTHDTLRPDVRRRVSQHPREAISTSEPSLGHDGKLKQALGQRIKEEKRSGWFWS
ncbi:MAG: hypothetical protein Q9216_000886 [Gyalolechia sp. 2 TL-2023]